MTSAAGRDPALSLYYSHASLAQAAVRPFVLHDDLCASVWHAVTLQFYALLLSNHHDLKITLQAWATHTPR